MATSELFPGESGVRQQVIEAGWSETIGNGWALVFEGPENENLTLRAYPSFFLEGVTPAYLIVETLEGDPHLRPLSLPEKIGKPLVVGGLGVEEVMVAVDGPGPRVVEHAYKDVVKVVSARGLIALFHSRSSSIFL